MVYFVYEYSYMDGRNESLYNVCKKYFYKYVLRSLKSLKSLACDIHF